MKFEKMETLIRIPCSNSYCLEFNYGRWNGTKESCFDLRRWKDNIRYGKGISFKISEFDKLCFFSKKAMLANKSTTVIKKYKKDNFLEAKIYGCYGPICEYFDKIKCITFISWGYEKVYDIRTWSNNFRSCSYGISLDENDFAEFVYRLEHLENMQHYLERK